MSENNSMQVGGVIAAFAFGALVGAGVALLYAPRSGKDTRALIADKGREMKGKATDAVQDAREFVDVKRAEVAAAFEAGKEAMREERGKHPKTA